MNFLNLEYFLVAAEELNFTKAAKRLYISQQSLSNHISKLESYYEAILFDRNPPLSLTNEGLCLVEHAKKILSIRDESKKEISDIRDFDGGDIIIGTPRTWGRIILPQVLPTYIAKYPNVKLHLRESITKELEIVLHKGEVDLCIGFSPNDRTDVETVHLCNEKVFLLIPENLMDNWFKSDADAVRDHLRTTGDVHLVEDLPFLMMDSSSHTGTLTRNMFLEQGITPNVSLVSRDMETLMTLCAQGLGMLFCPSIFVVEALQNKESGFADNVGVYPLKYEGFVREISISYLKNRYLPKAAKEFIRLTQECLKSEHFSHSLF